MRRLSQGRQSVVPIKHCTQYDIEIEGEPVAREGEAFCCEWMQNRIGQYLGEPDVNERLKQRFDRETVAVYG